MGPNEVPKRSLKGPGVVPERVGRGPGAVRSYGGGGLMRECAEVYGLARIVAMPPIS